MSTIDRLFRKSPFRALQRHMDQVSECVDGMNALLVELENGTWEGVSEKAAHVSELEHQADTIKEEIRAQLPRPLFMAVDRTRVLEILSVQDRIADSAEDVCVLVALRPLKFLDGFAERLRSFREHNLEAFRCAREIIGHLDEVIETGFGGPQAELVLNLAQATSRAEHDADVSQRVLTKAVLDADQVLSMGEFYQWMRTIKGLSGISNHSENVADKIRTTLELK